MEEVNKFCEMLMFLHPPWKVISVSGQEGGEDRSPGRVMIEMAYRAESLVPCPECGTLCKRHDTKAREWRDLDLMGWRTTLRAEVPRANCPTHGVRQISVPWAEPRGRFTMRFEAEVIEDLLAMPLRAVAQKRGLSWHQADGIRSRAVRRGLARRGPLAPKRIGIDETSFQKRHEYVSIVVDQKPASGRRGTVLYVGDRKDQAAVEPFFKELGEDACAQIETAAMDLAPAYIAVTLMYTPADICIDRFHVVSLLNQAVDQVRRAEHKALQAQGDFRLKGTRYHWLMSEERMGPARREHLKELRRQDLKVARAWILKEQAAEIWELRDRTLAYYAWEAWYQAAKRSRLAPVVKAAKTIWKHVEEILNAAVLGISNALSESINSKIQWIKRQACGYRSRERFREAIYFHLGGLDLYPRPPFHTKP